MDHYDKLWIQKNLNDIAIRRAQEIVLSTGRALPCSVVSVDGSIVTVKFEVDATPWPLPQVTIPKAESRWIRTPIQPGDFGIAQPADAYLGGISGLGGGTATLRQRGNLSTLVYVPIANVNFSSVNTNAAYVSGPEGAVIQTADGTSSLVVNENGITASFGGHTLIINSSGITLDGKLWDTHSHLYQPGSGSPIDTGPPV
jgi:hypothetical protein